MAQTPAQPAPAPAPAAAPAPAPSPTPAPAATPTPAPTPAPTAAPASVSTGTAAAPAGAAVDEPVRKPAPPPPEEEDFWLRYRPTNLSFEAGVAIGVAWYSGDHNLQDLQVVTTTGQHQGFRPGVDMGLRVAFFPLSWIGVEAEGNFIPTKTDPLGKRSDNFAFRGSGVLQLPLARIVPFIYGGGGIMSANSGIMGSDTDPLAHFGGGLKFAISQDFSIRLDVRDNLLQKNKLIAGVKDGDVVHNGEALFGFSYTFGRTPWSPIPPPPPDSDGDGVDDAHDECPTIPGTELNGCPPKDTDGDKIPDKRDACPTEPEDGNPPDPTDGCPNKDMDGDGIPIPQDLCPNEKGIAPDGCPDKDADKDGIPIPQDKCPDQPETRNGFEDEDGCPDVMPKEMERFQGVIKGIEFDLGKATIRKSSNAFLDDAVAVLTKYPSIRIRISGHTDSTGTREKNMKLSQDRADSVKNYITGKGIDGSRIETRGVGPDEPIEDNKKAAGRAKNRRIEFMVVPQSQ